MSGAKNTTINSCAIYETTYYNTSYDDTRLRNQLTRQQNLLSNANQQINELNKRAKENALKNEVERRKMSQQTQNMIDSLERSHRQNFDNLKDRYNKLNDNFVKTSQENRNEMIRLRNEQRVEAERNAKEHKKIRAEMAIENARIQKDYNKKIQQTNNFVASVQKEMKTSISAINANISDLRKETKQQITKLSNRLNDHIHKVEVKERIKADLANTFSQSCSYMIKKIEQSQYQLVLDDPDLANTLKNKLANITSLKSVGASESIIAQTQIYLEELNEQYLFISAKEYELSQKKAIFKTMYEDLHAEYEAVLNLTIDVETENGLQTIPANVKYWADENVKKFLNDINNETKNIENMLDKLTLNQIDEKITLFEQFSNRLNDVKEEAIEKQKKSIFKVNTSLKIEEILSSVGYTTDESSYTFKNDDPRDELHLKFNDGIGNDIVVVLKDEGDDCKVELNFFDKENDERLHSLVTTDIYKTFKNNGIDIALPTCEPGYETRISDKVELLDIEKTKRGRK